MHQISPSVCGSLMWQQNNRVPSQPNRTHSACKTDTEKPNSRFPWLFASTGVNGTMCVALQTHRTEYSEGFSRNPVKKCVFFPLASLFKQAIDPILLIYDTNFFAVKRFTVETREGFNRQFWSFLYSRGQTGPCIMEGSRRLQRLFLG